jgi:hypothetical protein
VVVIFFQSPYAKALHKKTVSRDLARTNSTLVSVRPAPLSLFICEEKEVLFLSEWRCMFRYEYYCGGANNDEIAALSFGV